MDDLLREAFVLGREWEKAIRVDNRPIPQFIGEWINSNNVQYKLDQMRKNIDIKEEDVQPLKILAVLAGKDLKNYIQDLLTDHVRAKEKNS